MKPPFAAAFAVVASSWLGLASAAAVIVATVSAQPDDCSAPDAVVAVLDTVVHQ